MTLTGEESAVLLVVFLLAIGVVWLTAYAWFDNKYGDREEYLLNEQREHMNWITDKTIGDLRILKATPMVELLTASGNRHTITLFQYRKHENDVEINGSFLKKSHIEQYTYFWMGQGYLHNSEDYSQRELAVFKVNGKEFTSINNIEWMTTYSLFSEDVQWKFTRENVVWVYDEENKWEERTALLYSRYFTIMNQLDKEERDWQM